jgi:galactokinase
MASAVGGFVYLNFGAEKPVIEPIPRTLDEFGYRLCIVAPGGSHADLQEDYASIPNEMRAVADRLGRRTLSGITPEALTAAIPRLRGKLSDRALLRAMHFVYECDRVEKMREALNNGDISSVLAIHRESGHSSFEYLQNVYTTKHADQGLSLAIALSERHLYGKAASVRVHGGGFAGTIQALLPDELVADYKRLMDSVFGDGSTVSLKVRPLGAVRII